MRLNVLKLMTLFIVALSAAAPWAHVLELPQKMLLSYPLWLDVTQNLYAYFAYIGAPIELAAVCWTTALAIALRHRPSFVLTLFSAFLLMFNVFIWFVFVSPVNSQFAMMVPELVPKDWATLRAQWEYAHAARAAIAWIAFLALAWSMIRDAEDAVIVSAIEQKKELQRAV